MNDTNHLSDDEVFVGPVTAKEKLKFSGMATPTRQRVSVYFPGTSTPDSRVRVFKERTACGTLLFSREDNENVSMPMQDSTNTEVSSAPGRPMGADVSVKRAVSPHSQSSGRSILKQTKLFHNKTPSGGSDTDSGVSFVGEIECNRKELSDSSSFARSLLFSTPPSAKRGGGSRQKYFDGSSSQPGFSTPEPSKLLPDPSSAIDIATVHSPHPLGFQHAMSVLPDPGAEKDEKVSDVEMNSPVKNSSQTEQFKSDSDSSARTVNLRSRCSPLLLHDNASPCASSKNVKKSSVIFKDFPIMCGEQHIEIVRSPLSEENCSPAASVASPISKSGMKRKTAYISPSSERNGIWTTKLAASGESCGGVGFEIVQPPTCGQSPGSRSVSGGGDADDSALPIGSKSQSLFAGVTAKLDRISSPHQEKDASFQAVTGSASAFSPDFWSGFNRDFASKCSQSPPTQSSNKPCPVFASPQEVVVTVHSPLPLPLSPSVPQPASESETAQNSKTSHGPFFPTMEFETETSPAVSSPTSFVTSSLSASQTFSTLAVTESPLKTGARSPSGTYFGAFVLDGENIPSVSSPSSSTPSSLSSAIPTSATENVQHATGTSSHGPLFSAISTDLDLEEIPKASSVDEVESCECGDCQDDVYELDELNMREYMTRINTLKNSEKVHTVLDPNSSPALLQEFPPEKEATKISWKAELKDVAEAPKVSQSPAFSLVSVTPRSILTQRPVDHEFPFSKDPPTPIVITKKRRVRNEIPISYSAFRQFMVFRQQRDVNDQVD